MKAVLVVLVCLAALASAQIPLTNATSSNWALTTDCLYQYYTFDTSPIPNLGTVYFELTVYNNIDTYMIVCQGITCRPNTTSIAAYPQQCNSGPNPTCFVRIDCAFLNQGYTVAVIRSVYSTGAPAAGTPGNFSVKATDWAHPAVNLVNATVVAVPNSPLLSGVNPLPAFDYDHYMFTVPNPVPSSVNRGGDIVINVTAISGGATGDVYVAYNHMAGQGCTNIVQGAATNFVELRINYCTVQSGVYYVAVKRFNPASTYSIVYYYDSRNVITLTPPTYGEHYVTNAETFYTFTTNPGVDEIEVNVYDVAGGQLDWYLSRDYVYSPNNGTSAPCAIQLSCVGAGGADFDACRKRLHICPSTTTAVVWYVTVKATTISNSFPTTNRLRDFVSYWISYTAIARTNTALTYPFVLTKNIVADEYHFYQVSLPSVITNQTLYVELYVDSAKYTSLTLFMNDASFAGSITNGNSKCAQNKWSCTIDVATANSARRCWISIPPCQLIPGSIHYWGVNVPVTGGVPPTYGDFLSYTFWASLRQPMLLQDSISYQDYTLPQVYQHYYYDYSALNAAAGDALLIEVTNFKPQTQVRNSVYVKYQVQAGECPCFQYDWKCSLAQNECLFDTKTLTSCGIKPGTFYISVLGENYNVATLNPQDSAYTITITKYNYIGPINTIALGSVTYGYVVDSETVYYDVDTTALSKTTPQVLEFNVRFVEYNAHDNEILTLNVFTDSIGSSGCAKYTCTTNPTPLVNAPYFSHCKIILEPCQVSTSSHYYVSVTGKGGNGAANGRPMHYTVEVKDYDRFATTLVAATPVAAAVSPMRFDHYKYTVAPTSLTNKITFYLYSDFDQTMVPNMVINWDSFAGTSPCYTSVASCVGPAVPPDVATNRYDCEIVLPPCALKAADIYVSVYQFPTVAGNNNYYYNEPLEYTLVAMEKPEIVVLGAAGTTTPVYDSLGYYFSVVTLSQPTRSRDYRVYSFDTSTLGSGDVLYVEFDQVEFGRLDIYAQTGSIAGTCPCYNRIDKSIAAGGTIIAKTVGGSVGFDVNNYISFPYGCTKGQMLYYFVQANSFTSSKYDPIKYSVAAYVVKSGAPVTLIAGINNRANNTVTKYTHRYYRIQASAGLANSHIVINLDASITAGAQISVYTQSGSPANSQCSGSTAIFTNANTAGFVTLTPCQHSLGTTDLFLDVTTQDTQVDSYQIWWTSIDLQVTTVTPNAATPGFVVVPANTDAFFTFPVALPAGAYDIQFTVTATVGSNNFFLNPSSMFTTGCGVTPCTAGGLTTSSPATQPYTGCNFVNNVNWYFVQKNTGGALSNHTIALTFSTAPVGVTPVTLNTVLNTWGQTGLKYYSVQLPASGAQLYTTVDVVPTQPSDLANLNVIANIGSNPTFVTGPTSICPSSATTCNAGATSFSCGAFDECCADTRSGRTLILAVLNTLASSNISYSIDVKSVSRFVSGGAIPNTNSSLLNQVIPTPNFLLQAQLSGVLPDDTVLLVVSTNSTVGNNVWFSASGYHGNPGAGTTSTTCFIQPAADCQTSASSPCTQQFDCSTYPQYVSVFNADAMANAVSFATTVYRPVTLTVNVAYAYTYGGTVAYPAYFKFDVTPFLTKEGDMVTFDITGATSASLNYLSKVCGNGAFATCAGDPCLQGGNVMTVSNCDSKGVYYVRVIAPAAANIVIKASSVSGYNRIAIVSGSSTTVTTNLQTGFGAGVANTRLFNIFNPNPTTTSLSTVDYVWNSLSGSPSLGYSYTVCPFPGTFDPLPCTNPLSGGRCRFYPCPIQGKTTHYFNLDAGANFGYNVTFANTPYTVTSLFVNTSTTKQIDVDTVYDYYKFDVPNDLKPFETVTVSIMPTCGDIYVVQRANQVAYPEAFPPVNGAGCYDSVTNPTSYGVAQTFTYTYCSYVPGQARLTDYYTIVGGHKYFSNLISYTITITRSGAPVFTPVPLRQWIQVTNPGPALLYFDTQTEAIGSLIYLEFRKPTTVAGRGYQDIWSTSGVIDIGCTGNKGDLSAYASPAFTDPTDSTKQKVVYRLRQHEYRDGRVYFTLNGATLGDTTVEYRVYIQRAAVQHVTKSTGWMSASLGYNFQTTQYRIATGASSVKYVHVEINGISGNTAPGNSFYHYIPNWSYYGNTGPFDQQLYGGTPFLGDIFTNGGANVNTNNLDYETTTSTTPTTTVYTLPLGACFFCYQYVYFGVGMRQTAAPDNRTVNYNIRFTFVSERQIPNDTSICVVNSLDNATYADYTPSLSKTVNGWPWQAGDELEHGLVWQVTNWVSTGEETFYYDIISDRVDGSSSFSTAPGGAIAPVANTVSPTPCSLMTTGYFETKDVYARRSQTCNKLGTEFHFTLLSTRPGGSPNTADHTYQLHPVVFRAGAKMAPLTTSLSALCAGSNDQYQTGVSVTITDTTYFTVTGSVGGLIGQMNLLASCPNSVNLLDDNAYCFATSTVAQNLFYQATSPYSFSLNTAVIAPTPLSLNVQASGLAGSTWVWFSFVSTVSPGQTITVSVSSVFTTDTFRARVMKDNIHWLCTTAYTADTSSPTAAINTLSVCDSVNGATYYVAVKRTAVGCSTILAAPTSPFTIIYTQTGTAIPAINNAVEILNVANGNSYSYTSAAVGAKDLLVVRLRNGQTAGTQPDFTAVAGAHRNSGACNFGQKTYSGLCHNPSGLDVYCVTEIPCISALKTTTFGFTTASANADLTVTQVTPTALVSGAATVAMTLNQDASYYSITQASLAALSLAITVTSGKARVDLWSSDCETLSCGEFKRSIYCDAFEGQCRIEFANRASHPNDDLTYFVKVSGPGVTYTLIYTEGVSNNIALPASATFCASVPYVNYKIWNYRDIPSRDAEAQRLYNYWSLGFTCPSVQCTLLLKYKACLYMFPQAEAATGFLLDTCASMCKYTETVCARNFTWAGYPEWECDNHFYQPDGSCNGLIGCDGIPNSGKVYDSCGVCGGNCNPTSTSGTSTGTSGTGTSSTGTSGTGTSGTGTSTGTSTATGTGTSTATGTSTSTSTGTSTATGTSTGNTTATGTSTATGTGNTTATGTTTAKTTTTGATTGKTTTATVTSGGSGTTTGSVTSDAASVPSMFSVVVALVVALLALTA